MNYKIFSLLIISTLFSQRSYFALDECIKISIENKLTIKKNKFDLERSELLLKESYSNILPSINFSADSRLYNQGNLSGLIEQDLFNPLSEGEQSSYLSNSIGFSLSQNIFDGKMSINRILQSKNYINLTRQLNKQNLLNIIRDVKVSYYNYLKSKQILEVSNSSLNSADEQLKLIQNKFNLGSAKKTDLLKAKVRRGQIRIQVINNNVKFENAFRNLKNAMGIIESSDDIYIKGIDISNLVIDSIPDYNQVIDIITKNNPGVLSTKLQLNNAKYSEKIAKGARYPNFRASLNYSVDPNQFYNSFENYSRLNTGISLSLQLYSGYRITSRIRQAKLNVLKIEAEYNEQIQNLSVTAGVIIDRLNNFKEILSINNTILMSAEEDVKLIKEKYNLGAASILELLDAEVSEISARSSIISVQYDLLIEQSNLNALLGKIDSEYLGNY